MPKTINEEHCRICGSTNYEDVGDQFCDEGYTACCNKRKAYDGRNCETGDCFHD